MNDEQLTTLLVQKGWFGKDELGPLTLTQLLLKKGIIGPEALTPGVPLADVLRGKGML